MSRLSTRPDIYIYSLSVLATNGDSETEFERGPVSDCNPERTGLIPD